MRYINSRFTYLLTYTVQIVCGLIRLCMVLIAGRLKAKPTKDLPTPPRLPVYNLV